MDAIKVLALALILIPVSSSAQDLDTFFPRPFGIAVNQVGYMDGSSLGDEGGPWRAGIRRDMDVRDYRPIAVVGEAVGVRFMSLFALAEMDRLNIVATLPHATRDGLNYDNSPRISNKQLEIMNFVKSNAASIEMGVTGVGHEWWVDGVRTRSEWYDLDNNRPRDPAMLRRHMEVIKNILWQYGLSEDKGHRFPRSFSALGYHWNPAGPHSNGQLFGEYGVRFVSTKFYIIPELNPPKSRDAGYDHNVLVMDREGYGNEWYEFASLPSSDIASYGVDLIESHWANWLATDDHLQPALNQKWIEYLKMVQAHPHRYLAKNTDQLLSQWLYRNYAKVATTGTGTATIDNRAMPAKAYDTDMVGNLVLAIPLKEGERLEMAKLGDEPIASYLEEAGYAFLYLPPLERARYTVTWSVGAGTRHPGVFNTGTYSVYRSKQSGSGITYDIQMHGTQTMRFVVPSGYEAVQTTSGLTVTNQWYDSTTSELHVTVSGHDIQGQIGTITIDKK